MAQKLILSRKGFDSGTGGKPSPIVEEHLISLPIPQAGSGVYFRDLCWPEGGNYLEYMQQLGITFFSEAHLDPDLEAAWKTKRPANWRAAFGQTGAAASHLHDQGVGPGDLFLFFGWFKPTEKDTKGRLRYLKKAPDQHIIYGYLEVDRVVDLRVEAPPPWAEEHPHWVFREQFNAQRNDLYLAKEKSSFWPGRKGAGTFAFAPQRVLTYGEGNRSLWKLPSGFFRANKCRLSYHEKRIGTPIKGTQSKWRTLQSVARGQEFVCTLNQALLDWLFEINS